MQTAPKKVVNAWAMYDWANSVYNLVITTTFFPIYFMAVTKAAYGEDRVPLFGRSFKNSSLYDYSLGFAYLVIAVLLPILSSIADSRGNKKSFMKFFCYLGGLSCCGLFFFKGEHPNVFLGLVCSVLAAVGYVGSLVFYNSYLPEIAAPEDRDRISAKGFSMGYIGSVILQAIGFGLVLYFESKNDSSSGPLFTFLLVGIWWIGFAQITFANLSHGTPAVEKHDTNVLTEGFKELSKVWQQAKKLPVLKRFLFAFFFYSMGVQTVMLIATIFAMKIFHLTNTKLIVTIVLIQLVAIIGATVISRLSAKFGNLRVLMSVVVLWIFICLATYIIGGMAEKGANAEYGFYAVATAIGLVMGGIQSLSRSTYSKLMPETKDTASFFSFYDITEKFAIVIGMFSIGFIDEMLGMLNGVLSLIIFFCIGLVGLAIASKKQRKLMQTQYSS